MNRIISCTAVASLLVIAGCSKSSDKPEGPTVDSFTGRVVADGKPVSFPTSDKVEILLFSEKGSQMRVPISSDGTFKLGWMPIGKHSATLTRDKSASGKKGGKHPTQFPVAWKS